MICLSRFRLIVPGVLFVAGCAMLFHAQSVSAHEEQKPAKTKVAALPVHSTDPGERAFQEQCSRCHDAPEALPRRVTGAVVLHMRVRANLTAQQERDILNFLAP